MFLRANGGRMFYPGDLVRVTMPDGRGYDARVVENIKGPGIRRVRVLAVEGEAIPDIDCVELIGQVQAKSVACRLRRQAIRNKSRQMTA